MKCCGLEFSPEHFNATKVLFGWTKTEMLKFSPHCVNGLSMEQLESNN